MKHLFRLLVFLSLALPSASAVFADQLDPNIAIARSSLKDFALISCLIAIDPGSSLANDLALSKRAFSFAGKGHYMIMQDEYTLEMTHDPYYETVVLMLQEAQKFIGIMKSGEISQSYGCFQVYHSQTFDAFVATQDEYILPN
ncbi:hypothetical protein ACMG4P_22710 [Pseudovibrio denitrificans]|uniref:hypothetical protein n=1 Tax=Pseudovibrio denitrificans TaxID=258256 RepID=UPI0039BF3E15